MKALLLASLVLLGSLASYGRQTSSSVPPRLVLSSGSASNEGGSISADGRLFFVKANDYEAKLWSLTSGRLVRSLPIDERITCLALIPAGPYGLVGQFDGSISIWDLATGRRVAGIRAHDGPVNDIAVSRDGKVFVTASDDRTAKIWKTDARTLLHILRGHTAYLDSTALSPDGRLIMTGSADGTARIWDGTTGKQLRILKGHDKDVVVRWSSDSAYAMTSDLEDVVRIWDVRQGRAEAVLRFGDEKGQIPGYGSTSVEFATDSRSIYTAGIDNDTGLESVCEFDWRLRKQSHCLGKKEFGRASSFLVSSSRQRMIVRYKKDHLGVVWDLPKRSAVAKLQVKYSSTDVVAWSADQKTLITAQSSQIGLWDLQNEGRTKSINAEKAGCTVPDAVRITADKRKLYATCFINSLFEWNLPQGTRSHIYLGGGSAVPANNEILSDQLAVLGGEQGNDNTAVLIHLPGGESEQIRHRYLSALSPAEDLLVTDGEAGFANVYSTTNKKLLMYLGPQRGPVTKASFSRDGSKVLTASDADDSAYVWDVKTGQPLGRTPPKKNISVASFLDERIFAVTDGNSQTGIWDSVTFQELFRVEGTLMAVFRTSPWIVLRKDRVLEIWNRSSGKIIKELLGHEERVLRVEVSPDERLLASAGDDGTIRLWDVHAGTEVAALLLSEGGGWGVVSSDGRFDTERHPLEGASWVLADDPMTPVPIEIFMRDYYTPKLLSKLLRGERLPPVRPLNSLNRVQPYVEVIGVEAESATREAVAVRVKVVSQTSATQKDQQNRPLHSGVYDLHIFRDGQLVSNVPGELMSNSCAATELETHAEHTSWQRQNCIIETGERIISIRNVLVPQSSDHDQVSFTAYAFNSDRVRSEISKPFVINKALPPAKSSPRRAYLITMGVNPNQSGWDLTLAVPSANLARELFREKLQKDYPEIVEINLVAESGRRGEIVIKNATKSHLRAVLDLLAGRVQNVGADLRKAVDPQGKLVRVKPDDAVVLYVASHGYADSQDRFHLVPFDTGGKLGITEAVLAVCESEANASEVCQDAQAFLRRTISSDELTSWWSGVDGGELIMILDSCHSGAIPGKDFRPGPLGDQGFGQLAYDKGMLIFAATQANKSARATLTQGVGHTILTEALKSTLADEKQSIAEWLQAAEQEARDRASTFAPGQNKGDLQLPELMNFRKQDSTTKATPFL